MPRVVGCKGEVGISQSNMISILLPITPGPALRGGWKQLVTRGMEGGVRWSSSN